jgi:hypothetical protein
MRASSLRRRSSVSSATVVIRLRSGTRARSGRSREVPSPMPQHCPVAAEVVAPDERLAHCSAHRRCELDHDGGLPPSDAAVNLTQMPRIAGQSRSSAAVAAAPSTITRKGIRRQASRRRPPAQAHAHRATALSPRARTRRRTARAAEANSFLHSPRDEHPRNETGEGCNDRYTGRHEGDGDDRDRGSGARRDWCTATTSLSWPLPTSRPTRPST